MIPKAVMDSKRANFFAFWDYWNGLPKQDGVPLLQDYFANAPISLQPGMLILDLLSPEEVSVRLAGTAVVDAVGELTGKHQDELYSSDVLIEMIGRTWKAASHPCGYIHTRLYRNVEGYKMVSPGMGLPVRTSNPGLKTVMVFNDDASIGDPVGVADDNSVVQTFGKVSWIDIGSGIPDE